MMNPPIPEGGSQGHQKSAGQPVSAVDAGAPLHDEIREGGDAPGPVHLGR